MRGHIIINMYIENVSILILKKDALYLLCDHHMDNSGQER